MQKMYTVKENSFEGMSFVLNLQKILFFFNIFKHIVTILKQKNKPEENIQIRTWPIFKRKCVLQNRILLYLFKVSAELNLRWRLMNRKDANYHFTTKRITNRLKHAQTGDQTRYPWYCAFVFRF